MICETGFKGVDIGVGGGGGGSGGGGGAAAPTGVDGVDAWFCGTATIIIAIWARNFCNSSSNAEIFCMASSLFDVFSFLVSADSLAIGGCLISFSGLVISDNSSSSSLGSDNKSSSSVIQPTSAKDAISIWDSGFPSISSSDTCSFRLSYETREKIHEMYHLCVTLLVPRISVVSLSSHS